jgi:hypothetical protein
MNYALGLFVLSLLGAEGPAGCESRDTLNRQVTAVTAPRAQVVSRSDGPAITYDVRLIKIHGLEWRGTFFSQLQPVTTQMGGAVWTASHETVERLAALDPNGLKAPRMTAAPQGVAHLSDRGNRKVAAGLARLADGPFDHATQVAYTPQYEEVRDGLALTMTGRKLDQGVLACVVLDECRVSTVHRVALTESVSAKTCCASDSASAGGKVASRIEVPEFVHGSLAGEWLIPQGGALVLSLGVQTTADDAGLAVVTERVVLIEAAADDSVAQASLVQPVPDEVDKRAAAAAAGIPMPMPAMPSRSLPQALDADGLPMPLPPLPEDRATPSSLPGSAEPCASPQGLQRKSPEPTTLDTASNRANFTPASRANPAEGATCDDARPCVLRFPVNAGGMNVEVQIRMASPSALLEALRSSTDSR